MRARLCPAQGPELPPCLSPSIIWFPQLPAPPALFLVASSFLCDLCDVRDIWGCFTPVCFIHLCLANCPSVVAPTGGSSLGLSVLWSQGQGPPPTQSPLQCVTGPWGCGARISVGRPWGPAWGPGQRENQPCEATWHLTCSQVSFGSL